MKRRIMTLAPAVASKRAENKARVYLVVRVAEGEYARVLLAWRGWKWLIAKAEAEGAPVYARIRNEVEFYMSLEEGALEKCEVYVA